MKKLLAITMFAGLGLAGISYAQAMPVAQIGSDQASPVIHVFGGCGFGEHRGPHGACRPLFNCPAGYHPGPHGRKCFKD